MKFDIAATLDNKVVFIYTIIFPIGYFYFMEWKQIFGHNSYSNYDLISMLIPFIGYVVLINVLNNVIGVTYARRESGFLKMYSFIVQSKLMIILSPLILYYLITLFETICFSIIVMLSLHLIDLETILLTFLIVSIIYLPTYGILNIVLMMRFNHQLMSIVSGMTLLIALFAYTFTPTNRIFQWLLLIDPIQLLGNVCTILTSKVNLTMIVPALVVIIIDCLIGLSVSKMMPIKSASVRN
ncbi:hypothetical protein [Philodulcilactobacillus myokoensis]|nr:hypothetical protein [Philodulcilactobacillus myokoensis]